MLPRSLSAALKSSASKPRLPPLLFLAAFRLAILLSPLIMLSSTPRNPAGASQRRARTRRSTRRTTYIARGPAQGRTAPGARLSYQHTFGAGGMVGPPGVEPGTTGL